MGSTFCLSLWQGLLRYQEKESYIGKVSVRPLPGPGLQGNGVPMEELKDLRKHHVGTIELVRHELDKD